MSVFPPSLRAINDLPRDEKHAIYRTLIPDWVFPQFNIDYETLLQEGQPVVKMRCPAGSRAMEIAVYHRPYAQERDPALYLNMIDTVNNQLMVLLVVINDPEAPRFHTDYDLDGNPTYFGTRGRNIPEEVRAMQAGLAPGQIRAGLRAFRDTVPVFEDFVQKMGQTLFFIEPLAYHNAIIFERYGFRYMYGKREMQSIHAGFQPGGGLHAKLDGSTPFRQPAFWQSIRGRAWAIHDGVLGHAFTGFQMYKRIGEHAGINTFPDGRW